MRARAQKTTQRGTIPVTSLRELLGGEGEYSIELTKDAIKNIPKNVIYSMVDWAIKDYYARRGGWPDLLCTKPNEYKFVEVKSPRDKIRQEQFVWFNARAQMYIDHLSGIQALGRGPYPHDGSGYTLLAAGGRRVQYGPSQRMVVDLSDPSNCWSVIPGGESGVPTSNHYSDQVSLWFDGIYHPMFIEETSETFPQHNIGSELILVPRGGGTS